MHVYYWLVVNMRLTSYRTVMYADYLSVVSMRLP